MPECSSPKWPRYGCKFCPSSYVSRALLNRHHDLYLHEYTEAFDIKSVKTTLIKCHPLQIIRALRSKTGRHPGEEREEPRRIQWDELTFSPFDKKLDLAMKLYNQHDVDAFESRALMPATEWVAKLGYVHSPRKATTKNTTVELDQSPHGDIESDHGSSQHDDAATDEDDNADEFRLDPDSAGPSNNHDNTVEAQGANKFGIISRRLFANIGGNKQLAAGSGSHQVSSKDSVSINRISNDQYKLVTPRRKISEQAPELRRRQANAEAPSALFGDRDSEHDDESDVDFNTPTTKGRKGKGKEPPRFMDESDSPRHELVRNLGKDQLPGSDDDDAVVQTRGSGNSRLKTASVPNVILKGVYHEEPILISSDVSDQDDDDGITVGSDSHDAHDDADLRDSAPAQVKPKDHSHVAPSPTGNGPSKRSRHQFAPKATEQPNLIASAIRRNMPAMRAPHATPRTHGARIFTPGHDVPVVLWLNVMLYAGHPKFSVPVRLGCSRDRAIQQVREQLQERGIGEDWLELEGLEVVECLGACLSDAQWDELMANGGSKDVGLVWKL